MANPPNALELVTVLRQSPIEGRRGVVRLHPDALLALGAHPWSVLALRGARTTGALAALLDDSHDPRTLACDDLVLANLGVAAGSRVAVSLAAEVPARQVTLTAPPELMAAVPPEALRAVLLGKVVSTGDQVSLLAQDFHLPPGVDSPSWLSVVTGLHQAMGPAAATALMTVVTTQPPSLILVNTGTQVGWHGGPSTASSTLSVPSQAPSTPPPPTASAPEELVGCASEYADLRGRLDLAFHRPDLLRTLGGAPQIGVLLTGAPGSGKTELLDAAARAAGAQLVRVWAPGLASAEDGPSRLRQAADEATRSLPSMLVVEDLEALAPRDGPAPMLGLLLETVRMLLATGRVAVVGTTATPQDLSPAVVAPGLLDHEVAIPLPSRDVRRRLLVVQTRAMPVSPDVDLDQVAGRTPGFVAADLLSLCQEAAVRAAQRARGSGEQGGSLMVTQDDFTRALETVRPSALQGDELDLPDLSLDDVGDMAGVKQALTEAVLWPLAYPETFERLGVTPPKGVLLYGPPGCGKTFLVKALAGSGRLNVLSVKGAELLTKWVGESERGVRDLFRRARSAAPCLIFMDEIDALAPARGSHQDSATDGVVAALLTELDGIEDLRDVVVVGATNRPELVDPALLRPGRLERLVEVPPPDAHARAEILTACARKVPLAADVDLSVVAAASEGYSAADCAALLREAAMCAMRESAQAATVTLAHLQAASRTVKPSITAAMAAQAAAFASGRGQ